MIRVCSAYPITFTPPIIFNTEQVFCPFYYAMLPNVALRDLVCDPLYIEAMP